MSEWRTTTDTYTGKPFRWNETVRYDGYVVPCKSTKNDSVWLHPSRVPDDLLAELNDGRTYPRMELNLTAADLDALRRLADAQREVKAIAEQLLLKRTSRLEQRQDYGRRLNAVAASLRTVELEIAGSKAEEAA